MTVTDITVRDQLGRTAHFAGTLLAHSSSRRDEEERWTEIEIYRKADSGYVVHRMGMSMIYHDHESLCGTGRDTSLGRLPEGAVPCPDCKPPFRAAATAKVPVQLEETRHTVEVYGDVPALLAGLMIPGRQRLSFPARRALEAAAERDNDIADATTRAVVNL